MPRLYYGTFHNGSRVLSTQNGCWLCPRVSIAVDTTNNRHEVEVAYLLAEKVWRQGLGTEVAQAIVQYGFEQLKLSRLICIMMKENVASTKVAEKMGMTFEKNAGR